MNDSNPYFTRPDLVRAVRGEQRQRWQRGERVSVEELLQVHPTLLNDTEGVLDLIYSEVLLREESGETPSLDDYLARFPQWAAALHEQFEVHSALEQPSMTPGSKPASRIRLKTSTAMRPSDGSPPTASPPGYLMLTELGRGGMGVVWKARHERLNRVVALKMIRHGSDARVEERTRFEIEAEAVARLSHPNIVQIYEVGEYNGQPYLSLEFVDGPSLTQQLAGAPLPPRVAAELVETLARAIQYAHDQGILHRDLKPANILLSVGREAPPEPAGSRSAGASWLTEWVPKITDFGLAKRLDVDLGQTQSGVLIGTPSYMAPEQAGDPEGERTARGPESKQREPIGPAADIYSLGAVLYECLTGRPPFRGVTLLDTLLQVRSQDPVSPTQLQPHVPRDLEIICLKCLSKAPARRFGSALALADDLRRFRTGEPIRARPTPWWERVEKWARRRPAAAAALLAGVLLVVVLAGFTVALHAARTRAEDNFERAFQAVDEFFLQVAENRRLRQHDQRHLLHELLLKAQPYYEELLQGDVGDARLRAKQGRASLRLAEIVAEIQGPARAVGHARQAVASFRTLATETPSAEYRRDLAESLNREGELCRLLGEQSNALTALTEGRALREALVNADPTPRSKADLAQSWHTLGLLHHDQCSWDLAEHAYQSARQLRQELVHEHDLPGYRGDLAQSWNILGLLYHDQKRRVQAAEAYTEALKIREALAQASPGEHEAAFALAKSRHNLAGVHRQAEQWLKADAEYDRAIGDMKQLVETHASVLEYRDHLALFHYNRALLWHYQPADSWDLDKASALYGSALEIWGQLPESYRTDLPLTRKRMADCYYEWGKCALLAQRPVEARDKLGKAMKLFATLPRTRLHAPGEPFTDDKLRLDQARAAYLQGFVHYKQRESLKATPYFLDAVALWPGSALPVPEQRYELGIVHAMLSHCCERQRDWKGALVHAEKALALWEQVPDTAASRKARAMVRGTQALAWAHQGEGVKALAAATDVCRQEPEWVWASYRLARIYALQAKQLDAAASPSQLAVVESLRLLEHSSSVFRVRADVQEAEDERDLEPLRPLPEFQAWLAKIRKAIETPTDRKDQP